MPSVESGADAGWQPVEGSARELSTRFGLLTVVYRDGREGRTGAVDVLLNGQPIRPAFERSGDYGYVYFQNRFELGSQDVVVLSASAGGSGSPPPLLHVIVLGPDDERRVVSDPRFRSADGTQSVAADRGRLRFDLGYENGRRKTAVFDGDELTVDYRSVEPTPISVEQCSALYEIVVEECTPRGALTQLDGVPAEEFCRARAPRSRTRADADSDP